MFCKDIYYYRNQQNVYKIPKKPKIRFSHFFIDLLIFPNSDLFKIFTGNTSFPACFFPTGKQTFQ